MEFALTAFVFLLGLLTLVAGAQIMIRGTSKLALSFSIAPRAIGLKIGAFGTSVPELDVSTDPSLSGQVAPAMLNLDLPMMIAATIACLPIFFTGYLIASCEGGLFPFYCVAYTAYLLLATQAHDLLGGYGAPVA